MADQTATLAATLTPLSLEEQAATGFNLKAVVDFTDVNNADWTTDGDTVSVALGDTPTRFLIDKVAIDVTTAFATDGTLLAELGTDGDPNNFITSVSVTTAGLKLAAAGGAPATLVGSHGTSSDVLQFRLNTQSSTGAASDITAGALEILLNVIDLAAL